MLVTPFDRYALDYLLKPFDGERFAQTLRRATERLRLRRLSGTEDARDTSSPTVERLRVHRGALVHPGRIRHVETLPDGSRHLHLVDGSRVRVSRRRWPKVRERL